MDRLVVHGDVVHDVWIAVARVAVHALETVGHDVADFVGVGRVVGDERVVGGSQDVRVSVHVLQTLAGERRATGGCADDEALGQLVAGCPELVAGALEAEHRVEDVDRHHRQVVRGVRRADDLEGGRRAGLGDARVQDAALLGLAVGQHHVRVDGRVGLAGRVEDLRRGEDRVQTEGTGLVGDDRHEVLADLLVLEQVLDEAYESHGRGDLELAGTLRQRVEGTRGQGRKLRLTVGAALGHPAAEDLAALLHVLQGRVIGRRHVVRGLVGIALEFLVRDRDLQAVAQLLGVLERQLLHLVRRVTAREVRAQRVALNGVRENDGRLAGVVHGGLVGGVDLAVVVAAALELPELLVGPVLDHFLGARVAAEEVLTHVGAVVRAEGLVVAVQGLVHDVDEGVVLVGGEQLIPAAAPDDLDDVPAGALEEGLELLDDLAVAAHRAVETLQVAVDDEGQVVQALLSGELEHTAGLGLVHLTVTDEGPRVLLRRVLDAVHVQVTVEPGLVDGLGGTQAERDRGELPELIELARVRV